MNEFIFTLKNDNSSVSFRVASDSDINEHVGYLLSLFPRVNFETGAIEALHYNTPEFKQTINEFNDQYKAQLPVLNQLAAFVNRMPIGEPFFFIPFHQLDTMSSIEMVKYLKALKGITVDHSAEMKKYEELFGDLMAKYDIYHLGEERRKIGEPDKSKRICRFCKKGVPDVTFGSEAHAISEALGNKKLILFDECDSCNSDFAKTIEPQLIEYFSFMRTIYGIKGKGGMKQFEGKNFNFENSEDGLKISYEAQDEKAELPETMILESRKSISKQDLYRALVKYFLSVLPDQYLQKFERTIDWVKGKFDIDQLPVIANLFAARQLDEQPTMTLYLRKDEQDKSLPYAVGEFGFALSKFVFIVPCSSQMIKTSLLKNNTIYSGIHSSTIIALADGGMKTLQAQNLSRF